MSLNKKWKIEYFVKDNGRCPTSDFLDGLRSHERALAIKAIDNLEKHGLNLDRPHVAILRDNIYELRIKINRVNYRVLYFIYNRGKFILLQGFPKKIRRVNPKEINKAIEYRKIYYERSKQP